MYLKRVEEFNEVNDARNFKRNMRNDLMKRRQTEFMDGFEIITEKVSSCFHLNKEFVLVPSGQNYLDFSN